jgi:hypothetical protein
MPPPTFTAAGSGNDEGREPLERRLPWKRLMLNETPIPLSGSVALAGDKTPANPFRLIVESRVV